MRPEFFGCGLRHGKNCVDHRIASGPSSGCAWLHSGVARRLCRFGTLCQLRPVQQSVPQFGPHAHGQCRPAQRSGLLAAAAARELRFELQLEFRQKLFVEPPIRRRRIPIHTYASGRSASPLPAGRRKAACPSSSRKAKRPRSWRAATAFRNPLCCAPMASPPPRRCVPARG